ncbi:MAG: hypothetical protein QXI39_05630 [Candidatus Bathyarchaeia archaeon]
MQFQLQVSSVDAEDADYAGYSSASPLNHLFHGSADGVHENLEEVMVCVQNLSQLLRDCEDLVPVG